MLMFLMWFSSFIQNGLVCQRNELWELECLWLKVKITSLDFNFRFDWVSLIMEVDREHFILDVEVDEMGLGR